MLAGESELEGAGGGWSEVLLVLKTLLETGHQLPFQSGPPPRSETSAPPGLAGRSLMLDERLRYQTVACLRHNSTSPYEQYQQKLAAAA